MILIGTPEDYDRYICLDGEDAYLVHKNGITPKWKDGEVLYFEKSKKLTKILKKLNIELN